MLIIFHIGWPKTGSSSFQNWLWTNQALLDEAGILYPETGRAKDGSHNHLALSLRPIPEYVLSLDPDFVWGRLAEEIERKKRKHPYHTVIISSETMPMLFNYQKYLAMLEPLSSGMAIFAVVREQVSILRSLYAQHVKDVQLRARHTMMEMFEGHKKRFLYAEVLREYRESYPWKEIRVFRYGKGAPESLARALGDVPDAIPPIVKNVTPKYEAIEIVRRLNYVYLTLSARDRINKRILATTTYPKLRRPDLTEEEISEIKNYYASSNEELKLEYNVDFHESEDIHHPAEL